MCNSKILDLEKAIKEHAAQLSEIRGHLHTHKTPQHPVTTEMVRKPPISRPPNPPNLPKKPTLKKSTLPWIPATKRKFYPPKLKTSPPIEFVDRKPVISILQHNERRCSPKTQLPLRPTLALKNEAISTCPSTCYKIPSAQPHPTADTEREEKILKLEQLFIESMKDLLASFKELAPSPKLNLLT